jgi:FMN phosphatase YigB (HAD superfamily)
MPLSIAPFDLPRALELAPPGVKVLSLDCFDTLIWRNTHAPHDVFSDLEASGRCPTTRMMAEGDARRRAALHGRQEVTIAEIYRCLAPRAGEAALAALIQAELDAEARHCFPFRPTVELMRNAKAAGLQVIIVSDTYLDEAQLRGLIATVAGEEVAGLIDRIFCSSAYGRPKAGGLFRDVLKALGVAPETILHLGDNENADRKAPLELGVNAVHLEQFDPQAEQRLRLESSKARVMGGAAEIEAAVLQPHRAQIAADPERGDAIGRLGHAVLGPVMDAFVRWLAREADALQAARGGRVHMLFLMRDGYLPMRAFAAGAPESPHPQAAIEISRYTAQAAAFDSDAAVLDYADKQLRAQAPEHVAGQMLFTDPETADLVGGGALGDKRARFHRRIRKPSNLARVKSRSAAFAGRLVDYVRRTVRPEAGDTLMLVDLGYNGSVQNAVDGLLARELGVHVAGRYLLLAEMEITGLDKRGLFDHRHCDMAALHALSSYVAVLEQLCTISQGSVVDYGADGPVRRANDIKAGQSAVRDAIQAAALRYVAQAGSAILRAPASTDADAERRSAMAVLARLLFLPLPEELAVLRDFQHDVNLGSGETLALFEPALAEAGLRQRGLFYMKNSRRMYLSAELRGQGLPLSLTLLAQGRFNLDLRYKDFCDSAIEVPIMVAHGGEVAMDVATAKPTHDGYYLLDVPIGDCRYAIGVQFGQVFETVQLDEVYFGDAEKLINTEPHEKALYRSASPVFEGASGGRGGIVDFADENAFMLVPPPPREDDTPLALAVIFRPLVRRERAQAGAASIAAE